LTGQGWKTTSTAASETVDAFLELEPVQGSTTPTYNLAFKGQINGAGYGSLLTLPSGGGLNLNSGTYQINGTQISSANLSDGTTGTGNIVLATAPTFVTSITDPTLYGGAAAGSTLTLKGTSNGSPSSANIYINPTAANGDVAIGTTSPNTQFTVNLNTSANPPIVLSGQGINYQFVGADSTKNSIEMDGFANSSNIYCRRSDGTNASPSALASNDAICVWGVFGYDGSAWTGQQAAIAMYAAGTWTNAPSYPTLIKFFVTPASSSTLGEAMRINSTGALDIGQTSDTTGAKLAVTGGIAQTTAESCTTGVQTNSVGLFSACVASDARLKDEVKKGVKSAIDVLMAITPRFYTWKKEEQDKRDTLEHYGYFAQNVQQAFPDAVVAGGKGLLSVDPNAMNALNTKAIQEQQKEIEQLSAQIVAMGAQPFVPQDDSWKHRFLHWLEE